MFCDHWLLGVGWGCFELFYPFYQSAYLVDPVWAPFRTHANNAHQIILECVSQAGLIGFGILMWGVVLWIKLTREQLKQEAPSERFLRHGTIAALLGVVADNFLNVSFFFTAPAILIAWWAADCIQKSSFTVRFEGASKRQWFLVGLGLFISSLMIVHAFCLWMGEIKHFQGFTRSRGGVDLWQGVKDFESANSWYPWDVQTHYELANLHGRLGNFEQAIQSYDRAILSNPGYDEIYFNRGTLLAQQGRWAESLESFEKSHLIHPQFVPAQQAIAVIKARHPLQANLLK
jgi:tetratricopeptide (TPR) repeat protein